ncbi:hypothetical protein ODR87_14320, partial [Escherichia coli]|nr:hypothetical protein [Escherichia coli]MCV8241771.1 hypothetical protein [Escherichia coli]
AFSSGAGRTSDGNGSHASTLKSPSYTKSVSWQHYRRAGEKSGVSGNTGIVPEMDDAVEGLGYGNKPLYYRIQ